MPKLAFRMTLKPGRLAEYRARHEAIWPELAEALKDAGVRDYSIHHDPGTDALFASLWCEDPAAFDALAEQDVVRRWWAHMAPLMATNPDQSPQVVPLATVFHLD